MKTDYMKYFFLLTIIILITWTLSCSGRTGKTTDKKAEQITSLAEEPSLKLIKMISPDENAGFKLHETD